MDKGVPIRSVSRCIAVLQAINRSGSLSMMEIARASRVPYPTACRLVQTLLFEGMIEREPARRRYRPTALVQTLSHGFQSDGLLIEAARDRIVDLTRRIGWPVTICTHVGHSMVVRDSTHALSALTFNDYHPGYAFPMLETASGLVMIAHMTDEQRADLIASMRLLPTTSRDHILDQIEATDLLARIRRDGYATRTFNPFTRNPGKTSSIAAPVFRGGKVTGAVSLAYFASAMKVDAAVSAFAAELCRCAGAISAELATV